MFMPVSSSREVIDVVPESIVGRKDPLSTLRYDITNLPADHFELSDAVYFHLTSQNDLSGLLSAKAKLLHAKEEYDVDSSSHVTSHDAVLLSELKRTIQQALDGDTTAGQRSTSVANEENGECTEGNGITQRDANRTEPNIHILGQNEVSVLPEGDTLSQITTEALDNQRIGVDSFNTLADAALKQNVIDLASVFDPSNLKDLELFGIPEEDENDDNEEAAGLDLHLAVNKADSDEVEERTGLDLELDAVIGSSYGMWDDNKVFNSNKWRIMAKKKARAEDVWAVDDKMDVSDFAQLVPEMAIEYPFNLDVFQKRAVYRLERDESVFVAAHTSAGKTVVAEYAIALAMQRKTKVVYTSPIKTLSNQKFRDFSERFGDVGIITGDISINPEASCLVMTTEILRSMLYKGADLVRDLSHVIFDECHWLNDPERGVVWEETIILLPTAVNVIMLSATVPNAMEFAKWVGRTKQKQVYVVHTSKRPVPLSHHIFVKGKVYPLFDSSQGRFLGVNYRRAATDHKESTKNANVRFGGGRNHAWMPIIKYLQKRDLDPAIFFCFSKKKCNEAANQLHTQDLTAGATDRNQIHLFYQSAIARLSPSDRNVPQIARHREMLKRGIGVHHAGVLPIIKEITEVLFQQGLIRVLFATETFAMGVNMPARTVVFTALHKYDNQSHRLLEPGEYIQMAGRAGRRGLDEVGTVIIFPSAADFPVESDVKMVLTGTPKPLRSQFRLTYNMILNLLRIDELRVEDVMARSFNEAPAGRTSGMVQKLLKKGNETLDAMQSQAVELERFRALYQLSIRVDNLSKRIGFVLVNQGKNSTKSITGPGRIVLVRGNDHTFRVGVVIEAPAAGRVKGGLSLKGPSPKISSATSISKVGKVPQLVLKVLTLHGGPALSSVASPFLQYGFNKVDLKSKGRQYNAGGLIVEVQDMEFGEIMAFSSTKVEVNERGLVPTRGDPNPVALSSAAEQLREIAIDRAAWNKFPHLHPVKDMGLQDIDIMEQWQEREQSIGIMNEMIVDLQASGAIREVNEGFERLSKESSLEHKLELLSIAMSDESLQLMPDYKQRVELLRKLGYIDATSVRLKGRAACEVNTCESIILTELVFEKVLQKLDAVDLAAILCCLVFHEKIDGDETGYSTLERIREESQLLYESCQSMLGVLTCLGSAQAECGLAVSSYEFVRAHANFGFIVGVRGWANGKTFAQICEDCGGDIAEGSIVRTIVRLCQLLRETKNVGRVIGDPDLQAKAEESIALVRRDVIFAASLYLQS